MDNNNKDSAIQQACEHLGFDLDDTLPVEVIHDGIALTANEVIMRNLLLALKEGLKYQKLDKAERYDWQVAIDFVLDEVGE